MKTAALSALLLLGAALPAAAQMPPPPEMMPDGPGRPPMRGMKHMFASMSPAGRAAMLAAIRSTDPKTSHAATKAARDRMLAVIDADRLDPVALKHAMDDEREAATTAKVREQVAMIGAFQQLSLADRRAFVADARAMRERVESQMAEMKARRGARVPMAPPQ